jgi:hypothetical protein
VVETPPVVETPVVTEPPAVVLPPPFIPEAPLLEPPWDGLGAAPPLPDAESVPVEAGIAVGLHGASIVTIRRADLPRSLPSLLPSQLSDAVTSAGAGLHPQGASRSDTRREPSAAAERHGDSPLPPLPARERTPSTLYVSGGGASGGSSSGIFAWVLAGLIALLAAAAQRIGGLVSLTLAPPRCTAFALGLERPD